MPRQETEIRHAAVTNHSVPRSNQESAPPNEPPAKKHPLAAFPDAFVDDPSRNTSGATARDRAIALTLLAMKHPELMANDADFKNAVGALEASLESDPADYAAAEALAELYLSERHTDKAIQLCKNILDEDPLRETTLRIISETYSNLGQFAQATPYWERMVQLNPGMAMYWYKLGQAYAARRRWQRSLELAKEGKKRFPTSIGIRQLLIQSLLSTGSSQSAEQEFKEVVAFQPAGLDRLTEWYENHPARK